MFFNSESGCDVKDKQTTLLQKCPLAKRKNLWIPQITCVTHIWILLCSIQSNKKIKTLAQTAFFNHWELFGNMNVWIRVIPPSKHHQTTEHELCSRTHIYSADHYVAKLPTHLFFFFWGWGNHLVCSLQATLLVSCPRSLTFWMMVIGAGNSVGMGIKKLLLNRFCLPIELSYTTTQVRLHHFNCRRLH